MPVFSSQYNATIDDKGRVVLPSAYKRELGEAFEKGLTVEKDPYENCLNLYPVDAWEEKLRLVKSKLNPNNPDQSRFLDRFYQNFVKIPVAENGRINIPNSFYKQKNIVRDVVFSGQGDRIRLWNASDYQKVMMSDDDFKNFFKDFLGGTQQPL